jgi:DNA-directed RNA polymerase specialized sigma24 family protein
MADRSRGVRGVLAEIDGELARVEKKLASYEPLLAERRRLLAAKAALTGEQSPTIGASGKRRISQDEVAAYLAENPDSWPAEMAQALGVPVTNVSAHLHRGKDTRFFRGGSGWQLRRHS